MKVLYLGADERLASFSRRLTASIGARAPSLCWDTDTLDKLPPPLPPLPPPPPPREEIPVFLLPPLTGLSTTDTMPRGADF